MKRSYLALIHKEGLSDYGVSFPDLPGCITAGRTLDEARAMATEALVFHLEGLAQDGMEAPEPSSFAEVMAQRENRDAVAILVDAGLPAVKSVRINVSLPADVLAEIDRYAGQQGLTRSGFLAKAARQIIGE